MEVKKHGGKRKGSGRKKMNREQRKIRITIWPSGLVVKNVGGKRKAKLLAMSALESI